MQPHPLIQAGYQRLLDRTSLSSTRNNGLISPESVLSSNGFAVTEPRSEPGAMQQQAVVCSERVVRISLCISTSSSKLNFSVAEARCMQAASRISGRHDERMREGFLVLVG